jgi:integrase
MSRAASVSAGQRRQVPGSCERRKEHVDATRDLPKAAIERQLSRRDVPLREKTLWRMLYETAARASEILDLDVEQLDLEHRRAPIVSKGGEIEFRMGPLGKLGNRHRPSAPPAPAPPRRLEPLKRTVVSRQPQARARAAPACTRHLPAHRPARLGYDRARILLKNFTGWQLHQLRHSAATHLGDQKVPLQLIMAKTRHKSPRTAMRYVNPSPAAVAEVTELLAPRRRKH